MEDDGSSASDRSPGGSSEDSESRYASEDSGSCSGSGDEEEEEDGDDLDSGGSSSEEEEEDLDDEKKKRKKKKKKIDGEKLKYECGECGKKLRKPSLLEQHLLCHSNERKFCCPVDACTATYKRADHLKRHVNDTHEGEILSCGWPGCIFATRISADLKRHKKLHEKKGTLQRHRDKTPLEEQQRRQHACREKNCGKAFRYPSQLRYHEETKHGEVYVDIICSEPGCNEHFDHPADLADHTRNAHKYVFCEVCGKQCMRQKIKRHYETHDKSGRADRERIPCPYPDCSLSYLQENNLRKHIKVVHLKFKPYPCSNAECGKSFAYRHVRDNHERSVHLPGDFLAEELKKSKKTTKKRKTVESVDDIFLKKPNAKKPIGSGT